MTMTPASTSTASEKLVPPFDEHLQLYHSSGFIITHDAGPPPTVQITEGATATGFADTTASSPSLPNGPSAVDGNHGADTPASNLLSSLPTIYRDEKHAVLEVQGNVPAYLAKDLSVKRLNQIHSILWMAGRPLNARPLHRYVMMDLRILRTEQADLHILRVSDRLFIKPLPLYLLNYKFWSEYLCDDSEMHKLACGFLLSYVWLIISELDLRIAKENCLVPHVVSWQNWKAFVSSFIQHVDPNALDQVNKRYHYGELRLSRVNTIFRIRFFHTHFIRGYLYGYNRYVVFFQRNFGWMVVVFVYFSLVLSAMQVGVSIPELSADNGAFMKASYGFVVFSIVLVAAICSVVGILFVCIFTINTILSIAHSSRKRKDREKLASGRKGV